MRTIRVDEPESEHRWLWLAAGAALGVVAGVLLADRIRGRKASVRSLLGRGRRFATTALGAVGPILETARSIKEAWDERGGGGDQDEVDDAPDDAEESAAAADEHDDELEAEDGLDARVLEAFIHDPVLAKRAVVIDEPRPGVIMLRGRVRSTKEITHAMTIARGIPGVTRVRERLTVRERPR